MFFFRFVFFDEFFFIRCRFCRFSSVLCFFFVLLLVYMNDVRVQTHFVKKEEKKISYVESNTVAAANCLTHIRYGERNLLDTLQRDKKRYWMLTNTIYLKTNKMKEDGEKKRDTTEMKWRKLNISVWVRRTKREIKTIRKKA